MILFKEFHVPLILALVKDVTRREGEKRWNEGSFHQLKTSFRPADVFAGAKIHKVYQEALGDISDEHVQREGYETREQYFEAYRSINNLTVVNLDKPVWVVVFNVMGLMQVTIRDGIVGLLEYDDPILGNLKRAGVVKKGLFKITPVNVSPSEKFINEDLRKWQTEPTRKSS
jgi:hypothetical protein